LLIIDAHVHFVSNRNALGYGGLCHARVRARGAERGVGTPRLLRARPRSARVPLAKCCAGAGTLRRTLGTREYPRRRHPAVRLAQRAKLPQP
jgi:hypothetical protein